MATGIVVPEKFRGYDYTENLVADVEWHAESCWRYSALSILWRAWIAEQQEQGKSAMSHSFGGEYWEGEDEASQLYNRQVQDACEILDFQRLWKAISGFDINRSIERWDEQPGTYGYVLTYRRMQDFEAFVRKMFPTDTWHDCAYPPHAGRFPERDRDGELDAEAVLSWAVDMMVGSSVPAAFRAHLAGVPEEDILGG